MTNLGDFLGPQFRTLDKLETHGPSVAPHTWMRQLADGHEQ